MFLGTLAPTFSSFFPNKFLSLCISWLINDSILLTFQSPFLIHGPPSLSNLVQFPWSFIIPFQHNFLTVWVSHIFIRSSNLTSFGLFLQLHVAQCLCGRGKGNSKLHSVGREGYERFSAPLFSLCPVSPLSRSSFSSLHLPLLNVSLFC